MPGAASKSEPQAVDISRLLAGLQRGLVPGADHSVDFLCNKFSGLIERLQAAEAGEKLEVQSCEDLEATLQSEELKSDAERRHLEVATITAREETRKVEANVVESHEKLAASREQLAALRAETEALVQKKKMLDDLCRNERARVAETHGRLRRQQLLRPQAVDDVRRLQGQLQALNLRCAAVIAEIDGIQSRDFKEEERCAAIKSELLAQEEARDIVLGRAATHREDLDQALSRLAVLQEQLAERQAVLQRCTSECHRYSERRHVLQGEFETRRSWLDSVHQELEALQELRQGSDRVQAETIQLRAQLRVEEEAAAYADASALAKKAELHDTDAKLNKQTERMQQVEQQRDQLRAEAATAEVDEARLSESVEQLRHDQAAGGGMRRNLESELQMLKAEADKLHGELTFLHQEKLEAQQRFQLILPTLHEARRRAKDLDSQVEAARDEAQQEKEFARRLDRETDVCQEKLRALRDENVRLSEHGTELEAQLAQTARTPCFVPAKAAPRRSQAARPSRPPRTPSAGGDGRRRPSEAHVTSEGSPLGLTPDVSKLQQITEWIKNEEERLCHSNKLQHTQHSCSP